MKKKKTTPAPPVESALGEVWAGAFGLVSLLLVLSLASYNPFDLGINTQPANAKTLNAVGDLGAALSFFLFFGLGLGAWLLPVLLISAGVAIFLRKVFSWRMKLLWSILLLIGAVGLLDLQNVVGDSWRASANVSSVGGFIGENVNVIANQLLGQAGSAILWLFLYIASLIFLYEIRPLEVFQEFRTAIEHHLQAREERRIQTAKGPIAEAERLLLKEQKELQRRLQEAASQVQSSAGLPDADDVAGAAARASRRRRETLGLSSEMLAPPKPPASIQNPPAEIAPPSPPLAPVAAPEPEPIAAVPPLAPSLPEVPLPKARVAPVEEPAASNDFPPNLDLPTSPYHLPELQLLRSTPAMNRPTMSSSELQYNLEMIVYTLHTFGIEVTPAGYTLGATITRYEVMPQKGVRVDRISSLRNDLARALKAERINILAPVPGKDTVGIEIPNSSKSPVVLRDLFESPEWTSSKAKIPLALGKGVYGETLIADLAEMPHLLIAGTTGSGKSVCINCILLSLLYRFKPEELRLILVDPKQVEMQIYNTIPHLVVPVVVEPKKVLIALKWVINEMEKRYKLLAKEGVRNITAFNNRPKKTPSPAPTPTSQLRGEEDKGEDNEPIEEDLFPATREELEIPERLPYIVVIIDELADLMQTAPADVEAAIARLTAKARAAGIHLIVATQTPRREVVTGVIKTNIPCRIAFQVPSALDSRVVLDEAGAENLLGKGDMLYLPPGSGKFQRGQGALVTDDEVHQVVERCSKQRESQFEDTIHRRLVKPGAEDEEEVSEEDRELIIKCIEIIRQEKRASGSMLQRRLRVGYNKAAWVIEWLEKKGLLGDADGPTKTRELLADFDQLDPETLFDL